jgi:hypothetical protein
MSLARIADLTYSFNEYIVKYTMPGTLDEEPFSLLACNLPLAIPNPDEPEPNRCLFTKFLLFVQEFNC